MTIKEMLKNFFNKDNGMLKEEERRRKIERILDQRAKNSNERELERYMEEDRQRKIKKALEYYRKERKKEVWNDKSNLQRGSPILKEDYKILKDKNLFQLKSNFFK